jgi:hypothetical protein
VAHTDDEAPEAGAALPASGWTGRWTYGCMEPVRSVCLQAFDGRVGALPVPLFRRECHSDVTSGFRQEPSLHHAAKSRYNGVWVIGGEPES